ncbi:membrane protein [Anopheles sinensis]|uniref:Membrane protein n=1 Tax=Anopheles sinensis TaxID=74873 RepID=A0A084W3N6_ANOSI|nr:membrane protein [Anopheles sinensis]
MGERGPPEGWHEKKDFRGGKDHVITTGGGVVSLLNGISGCRNGRVLSRGTPKA